MICKKNKKKKKKCKKWMLCENIGNEMEWILNVSERKNVKNKILN
jgi:hypothetical protein